MTVQPTRDQLRALADAATEGPWELIGGGEYVTGVSILVAPDDGGVTSADAAFIAAARNALPQLLDQLDQQEAELDSWMARAYEAEGKLWKAEARIKAARDVLDNPIHLVDWDDPLVPSTHVRRALEE